MKRVLLVSLVFLTGCDFEDAFDTCVMKGNCEGAPGVADGGTDAGSDAGIDAGTEDAGTPDAGTADAGPRGPFCNMQGWCWQTPTPRVNLLSVVSAGRNEAWAFGEFGVALHFDGSSWSGIPGRVEDVHTALKIGPQTLLVGTENGLFVLDGGSWSPVATVSGSVTALGEDPAGEYFASTEFGANWFRAPRGGNWSQFSVPGKAYAFTFTGPGRGWASSVDSVFAYADGGWTPQSTASDGDYVSVWATGPEDVWAGGTNGELARLVNGAWVAVDAGLVASVVGASAVANDAWVMNNGFELRHWDGIDFGPVTELGPNSGVAISLSADDGWVVGVRGVMYRRTGTTWDEWPTGSREIINSIHGTGPDDIWAVGERGFATHFDGTTWTQHNSPRSEDLLGVFAVSIDDAWAVGAGGVIVHWNGTNWDELNGSGANALESVWVDGQGNAWIVGAQGTFWTATSISGVQTRDAGIGGRLTDVSGSGDTVFITSDTGSMVSCDAPTFTCSPMLAPEDGGLRLNSVYAATPTDVWVTADSYVERWNGTTWTQRNGATGSTLRRVRGDGTGMGVHVVGEAGHVRTFSNSGSSTTATAFTAVPLSGVFSSGGTTVVGGDLGALVLQKR